MNNQKGVVHSHLLQVAASLSTALEAAITQNGPLELPTDTVQQLAEHPYAKRSFPERLCRAVTGQQLSVRAAETIWHRVVSSAEEKPLMEYFAQVDSSVLRECGLSRAKVKTIGAIAHASLNGQLNATELEQLSHEERTARLTAIWGIGQWTADMMSIFYFGDPDIWPDGDVTARKTLEHLTSKRHKTIRTAARFSPYRSYLALHMWRCTDATP